MFSTVAVAYRFSTVSVTVSALEVAGFRVFCPGVNTVTLLPHQSLALGGVPIKVPTGEAREASEYLRAIQAGLSEPLVNTAPAEPAPAKNGFWQKMANALGYLLFGISAPWPELGLSAEKGAP
ncbi:hypothetical protein [Leisingera sp. S232]|uniref:hypothetical protein n=1 Tax=Leisingera sp. S232 TaxID=3415132 RepID=UPI003C7BA9DA